jgi:uncharacterized membrane protein
MTLLSRSSHSENSALERTNPFPGWFPVLLIGLIIAGICFRIIHLDQRVFWDDEVTTAVRISGYTAVEVAQQLYTGKIVSFADLSPYLGPNSHKNLQDVLQGLASEDPHMPLFYFILLRYWSEWFGSSILSLRSLSVVFGILVLPALYWLCRELFHSKQTALIATALVAIAPFHILYAQEARPYSCWTLVTILSSALLLRSLRQPTAIHWMGYAVLSVIGIYSHLFYVGVALGHGVYCVLTQRFKPTKQLGVQFGSKGFGYVGYVGYYCSAMILMAVAYLPWMLVLWRNRDKTASVITSAWANQHYSLPSLMSMWFGNMSRLFFDVGLGSHDGLKAILPTIPIILSCVLLIVYSLYFLWRQATTSVSIFVLTLIFTSAICFLASDLIIGGRLSGLPRYSIAMFLGYHLAIAYLFTLKLRQGNKQSSRRSLWWLMFILLIASCLTSYIKIYPAIVWWHQGPQNTRHIPEVIAQVNQTKQPIPAFGSKLKSEARIQLLPIGKLAPIPPAYETIFFFRPSPKLRQSIAQLGTLTVVPDTGEMLYRFRRRYPAPD